MAEVALIAGHSTARELAELVHQFLGYQVETSGQLSGGSKESLTVATECIEQAYEFQKKPTPSDRLLRIYESHIAAMANATSHCNEAAAAAADSAGGSTTATHPNHHPPTQRANTLAESESHLLQQHHQQQQPQIPADKQHSPHPISQLPMTTRKKLSHLRAQIKRQASSSSAHKLSHLIPGTHHHNQQQHSIGVSVHQKNFKQKLIALIKKFRTDGSNFDSEEQYREALERELIKATAGRGSRAIEELFEEEIDVDAESGSGPDDSDNISESSTPKPSLRPFFSSTTLDKI